MTFKDKVAVVTGGAQGIGKCIAECFRQEGATVHVIDIQQGPWFVGDLADKATLESFAGDVIAKSGKVDVLVNNAMPLFKGIDKCSYEEFAYAQAVGVVAPFYLAKLFRDRFAEGASIVNISSSRDRMSQPQSESYTAAKGGIAALKGKTVCLFQTHGGGGMQSLGRDFAALLPESKVLAPKAFAGSSIKSSIKALEEFATERISGQSMCSPAARN